MHVALGQKWLAIYAPNYSDEEKKLFMLGTVFPDIRYLGVIKRSQSHFKGVTLEKVYQATTPFQRGMLFHSFVDEFRDKLSRQRGLEKQFIDIPQRYRSPFLKLIEDQIIHEKYDWAQFRLFLASIPEEEKAFGIEMRSLTEWHTGLTLYFSALPSLILTQISLFNQGILSLDAASVKLWSTLLPKYAADPAMQGYVNDIMQAFDKALGEKKGAH